MHKSRVLFLGCVASLAISTSVFAGVDDFDEDVWMGHPLPEQEEVVVNNNLNDDEEPLLTHGDGSSIDPSLTMTLYPNKVKASKNMNPCSIAASNPCSVSSKPMDSSVAMNPCSMKAMNPCSMDVSIKIPTDKVVQNSVAAVSGGITFEDDDAFNGDSGILAMQSSGPVPSLKIITITGFDNHWSARIDTKMGLLTIENGSFIHDVGKVVSISKKGIIVNTMAGERIVYGVDGSVK